MDSHLISLKLEKLQEYISYLKGYRAHCLDEVKNDHTLTGAMLHYLQLSIECVLDIGEMMISALRLRKPDQAREIFVILAEQGIIAKDFARDFSAVAGLRNILVHEYADIDIERIYHYIHDPLNDFDLYARKIAQHISNKG